MPGGRAPVPHGSSVGALRDPAWRAYAREWAWRARARHGNFLDGLGLVACGATQRGKDFITRASIRRRIGFRCHWGRSAIAKRCRRNCKNSVALQGDSRVSNVLFLIRHHLIALSDIGMHAAPSSRPRGTEQGSSGASPAGGNPGSVRGVGPSEPGLLLSGQIRSRLVSYEVPARGSYVNQSSKGREST